MSHTIALFVLGFVLAPILWVFAPNWKSKAERNHERKFGHNYGRPPSRPQPRTREEARRWRADFEARR
jgi:hypothetical protein